MSDLSNDTKKHTTKSRGTIPLNCVYYKSWEFSLSLYLNIDIAPMLTTIQFNGKLDEQFTKKSINRGRSQT
jgi:hypothetical protein